MLTSTIGEEHKQRETKQRETKQHGESNQHHHNIDTNNSKQQIQSMSNNGKVNSELTAQEVQESLVNESKYPTSSEINVGTHNNNNNNHNHSNNCNNFKH